MTTTSKPAPVKWAQRNDLIYLCVELLDIEKPEVQIEKDKLIYKATDKDGQKYENTFNFFGEIKPSESMWSNHGRGTEFVLIKQESGPYWKRLLKETNKQHWLKVDFNRWKDEDESDDEKPNDDFASMMSQMGGFGGSSFNDDADLEDDDRDSDDENLPDLEDSNNLEKSNETNSTESTNESEESKKAE
ncbi:Uncharacterized protein SSS_01182 [Sarcoptes scabiei]|uniref:CS domain-containing protein n=2 Tax=Sarcoptes scabiei TaxID=52283 RepID=A0A834RCI4_SARSC|nr:Uncharacterized protein SSS_01182 [Sarcoptes scabiei]